MAKRQGGRRYYYLVESARVGGKPRIVSQRYLGSAEEVAARLSEAGPGEPTGSRHLAFGDVAAVWGMLSRLGYAGIVDAVVGARRADAGASVGTYLALACTNRVVAPRSKLAFADWWAATAADRWVRLPAGATDHRRFWDAMDTVHADALVAIERRLAAAMVGLFELGLSGMALDMTNFGGVPLVGHAYPGNRPDVAVFTAVVDELVARWRAIAAADHELTVVFDAGQNSAENFTHLAEVGLHFVGSLPPSDYPQLLALPARRRRMVDADRFAGLTAYETRAAALGAHRRVILTHSPTLHAKQVAGFEQTIAGSGMRWTQCTPMRWWRSNGGWRQRWSDCLSWGCPGWRWI